MRRADSLGQAGREEKEEGGICGGTGVPRRPGLPCPSAPHINQLLGKRYEEEATLFTIRVLFWEL